VLAALDCLWVSHPHDVARAEWKPLQLQVAASVGLTTPRTLISNDAEAAREFTRKAAGPVVCKTLSPITHIENGEARITYTTVIEPKTVDTDTFSDTFSTTAHLLQEWVPKRREARVTVAGSAILATGIEARSDRAHIDWRADYGNLNYHPIEVPADIANGLLRYLAVLGLRFGAFDFVITPDGQWVMLECNPNAQWLWLHDAPANLPIPAAIADLLTEGF
jgi:glutathione synthase/RimK-type ligase-like ATP-grasp enzyme